MSFEKLSTILEDSDKRGTATLAFNCINYESIAWLIKAGEELDLPVIVMLYPSMKRFMPIDTFAAITKSLAVKAKVPVGLHLDHCESFETIMEAIKAGFTSVMIDGSRRAFDENVNITKEIVRIAHSMDVDVEGELGKVGVATNKEDFQDSELFTTVDDAKTFVERTGVDALAIAFGSAHGFYVETPKLDMQRLKDINAAIPTPLVLHGGTGIPDNQIQEAFRLGINKLNIGTEYFSLFYSTIEDYVNDGENRSGLFPLLSYQEEQINNYLIRKLSLTKI